MQNKHTSGPWKWQRVKENIDVFFTLEGPDILCRFWDMSYNGKRARDADIIEAAPDMLEALQAVAVVPWGYCVCPEHMGDMENSADEDHCGECRLVRAAIAKAEGGIRMTDWPNSAPQSERNHMRRHMGLIVKILKFAETKCSDEHSLGLPKFEDWTTADVTNHVKLCEDAGFLIVSKDVGLVRYIVRLTWNGYEFLDKNRGIKHTQ